MRCRGERVPVPWPENAQEKGIRRCPIRKSLTPPAGTQERCGRRSRANSRPPGDERKRNSPLACISSVWWSSPHCWPVWAGCWPTTCARWTRSPPRWWSPWRRGNPSRISLRSWRTAASSSIRVSSAWWESSSTQRIWSIPAPMSSTPKWITAASSRPCTITVSATWSVSPFPRVRR